MIDLAAVEQAPFVRFLATAHAVYPALSAAHILGIALLVGPLLILDARLAGLLRGRTLLEAGPMLVRAALAGFALAAATGALLFSVKATDYVANPAFLAKLAIIAGAGVNALVLRVTVPAPFAAGDPPAAARAAGVVSILAWLAAILAGRWIAFV